MGSGQHGVGAIAERGAVAVSTEGRWIGPAQRPLLTWVSTTAAARASGILILPPVGYQWWSTHRSLRVLAERLADAGHVAMRLDYDGTGDSAGDQWEPDRVAAWRESVAAAVAALRAMGCVRVQLVGVRLGATLALLDGARLDVDGVAAWAPVTSGRRWSRELKMLGDAVPEDGDRCGAGTIASAGIVFSAQTMADLGALAVAKLDATPAPRVLLVDAAVDEPAAGHLRALGCDVDARALPGGDLALEQPTEDATVPEAILDAVCGWLADPGDAPPLDPPAGSASASISWDGTPIREEVVRLGPERFVGILSTPAAQGAAGPTLVFLNTGSEPHVGPGRAWVEFARGLAARGHRCLRVDWRGWGESPDAGRAPGRPYDPPGEDDTLAIVAGLRREGHEQIVLVGLCASAWMALRAVLRDPTVGVIALNPQLYWHQGDPVIALLDVSIRWRRAVADRERRLARWHLWTALDVLGHRPWGGRWLDDLRRGGARAGLVFVRDDPGILFLRTRLRRRLDRTLRDGAVALVELDHIDHSMHRAWARPVLLDAIAAEARRLTGPARRAGS